MFQRTIQTLLSQWKNKPNRKPLILRGARQVGKTSVLTEFGKQEFNDTVFINLENPLHARIFDRDMTAPEFITAASAFFKHDIEPGKTLIIIDEIQESDSMIKLLRFLYEDMPALHVVAAGSLLEIRISQGNIPIPVGRVEFAYLYPLDFFEYLVAIGEHSLLCELKESSLEKPPSSAVHEQALRHFSSYSMIGGMPEVVDTFVQTHDIQECRQILSSIMTAYTEDVYRYTTIDSAKYTQHIIQHGALHIGELYTYEGFAGSSYRSREMANASDMLEKAMILKQIEATQSSELPLTPKEKRPKKLLWLDAGFVNLLADLYQELLIAQNEINNVYRGKLAEQICGQQIQSWGDNEQVRMYYWAKEKDKGDAELDYCFQYSGRIVGVEVKSGSTGKLRSLHAFLRSVTSSVGVRVYSGDLRKDDEIISVPFYLVPRLKEVIS